VAKTDSLTRTRKYLLRDWQRGYKIGAR